ncbi:hypothetical protein BKA81DRAFT_366129 [Phyllosticta paracitricarpa]
MNESKLCPALHCHLRRAGHGCRDGGVRARATGSRAHSPHTTNYTCSRPCIRVRLT